MQPIHIVVVVVALIIVAGVLLGVAGGTSKGRMLPRFIMWAALAVGVLVYVVAEAMSNRHHWFGLGAMVFLLCTSTYDLVIWRRGNR
jgi:hypothetical protein